MFLSVVFTGAAAVMAQQEERTPAQLVMSPVPFWTEMTQNRVISERRPAALFDRKRGQVVVYLPGAAGLLEEQRYDIPNGTRVQITASVERVGGRELQYRYSLAEQVGATQSAAQLSLLVPASDPDLPAGPFPGVRRDETSIGDRANGIPGGRMAYLTWSALPGEGALRTVTLRSSYRPGFGDAFVSGGAARPLRREHTSLLPADLAGQVEEFLAPGVGSNHHLVLAPMFHPEAPRTMIAANFHQGLSMLLRSGALPLKSTYAQELLQTLAAFLHEESRAAAITLPAASPASPVEAAIHQAALISLY